MVSEIELGDAVVVVPWIELEDDVVVDVLAVPNVCVDTDATNKHSIDKHASEHLERCHQRECRVDNSQWLKHAQLSCH
jgi:hypothetical protein